MNTRDYTDALERALGRVIADAKREIADLKREMAAQKAQAEAVAAARDAEARAVIERLVLRCEHDVAERLATVRDGKDADPVVVARMVGDAVAAVEIPQVDLDVVARMVDDRIAALPPAERGEPGKDADPEVIERMIADAVAAKPLPDVVPVVERAVAEAIAARPLPIDGKDGVDGKDGIDGKSVSVDEVRAMLVEIVPPREELIGPPGRLPLVREWQDDVHYTGDVVTRDGEMFQAVRDTGRPPPHDDWIRIAARGRDGRSVNVRALFDPYEQYNELDIVALNGGSFIALRDDPGECPGDGWQLLASRGKAGPQGPQGVQGDKGERGAAGEAVVAADVDAYGAVTLTNGDGSTVTLDLYPVLATVAGRK
jgi:hypothetical protein